MLLLPRRNFYLKNPVRGELGGIRKALTRWKKAALLSDHSSSINSSNSFFFFFPPTETKKSSLDFEISSVTTHSEKKAHTRTLALVSPIDPGSVSAVPLALEYANVGPSEGGVAQRVKHRIYRAVDVAQVVAKVPHVLRYAPRARGQRLQQHQDVVGRPGHDEGSQDGRQGFRGLLVGLLLLALLLDLLHRLSLGRLLARPGHGLGAQGYPVVEHVRRPSDEGVTRLALGFGHRYYVLTRRVELADRVEAYHLLRVHADAGYLGHRHGTVAA